MPAGTLLRLPAGPAAPWFHTVDDQSPGTQYPGVGEEPVKADYGAFSEMLEIKGQFTDKFAKDTTVWNTTNIAGVTRTSLLNALEFRDILVDARKLWWKEAAAGNWYDDGAPARAKGLCRLRVGDQADRSVNPPVATKAFYLYGYVRRISINPPSVGSKDAGLYDFGVLFERASITSAG